MPKQEVPLQALSDFLPPGTSDPVLGYLNQHGVHLTISRARKSVLGDYRNRYQHQPHRISVNGNLNPYAFLITLLHELAHLLCHVRHGHFVKPHGAEWKQCFKETLAPFVNVNVVVTGQFETPALSRFEEALAASSGMSLDEVRAHHVEAIPLKRVGTAREFANVVAFLCSRASSFVTGSVVRVDGGSVKGF